MAEKKAAVQAEKPVEDVGTEAVQAEKRNGELSDLHTDPARRSGARMQRGNGEAQLIQRGVDVEVPAAVAEVLRHSEEMDNAANEKIAAAVAKAQDVPALQRL